VPLVYMLRVFSVLCTQFPCFSSHTFSHPLLSFSVEALSPLSQTHCRLGSESESESEIEFLYYWRFTNQSLRLVDKPLETHDQHIFFFQLNTGFHIPYVRSSVTRGWVCHLQLLLVLASSVILRFESHGTHDHILISQIRYSPNLEGPVPILMYTPTGWSSYNPRHWVPFSSPPKTRRDTVEVFEPVSTRNRF
jgi:hypothetical protein